jgi:hypothetical protein
MTSRFARHGRRRRVDPRTGAREPSLRGIKVCGDSATPTGRHPGPGVLTPPRSRRPSAIAFDKRATILGWSAATLSFSLCLRIDAVRRILTRSQAP